MAAADASVAPVDAAPMDATAAEAADAAAVQNVPAEAAPEESSDDPSSSGTFVKVKGNSAGKQGSQASCQDYTEAELDKFLEDSCQWTIFEDPEDEICYLRRRGGVLACALLAAREEIEHLHEAGVALQDAYERYQESYRQVAGDAAYWQEVAQTRAEELASLQARCDLKADVPAAIVKVEEAQNTNAVESVEAPPQSSSGDVVFHECEAENTQVSQAHQLHEGGCNSEEVTYSSLQAESLRRPLRECQPPQEGELQAKVTKDASLPQEGAGGMTATEKQVQGQPPGEPEPEESFEALEERQQRELRAALRAAAAEAAQAEALRRKKMAEQRTEEAEAPKWFGVAAGVSPGRRALGTCTPPNLEPQASLPAQSISVRSAPHIAAAGATPPPHRCAPRAAAASPQPSVGSPSSTRDIGECGSEYSLSEVTDSDRMSKVSDAQSRGQISDARTPPRQRTPLQPRTPTQCLAAPRTPTAKPSAGLGEQELSVGSACGGSRRALFSASPTSAVRNKPCPGSAPRRFTGLGTPTRRKQVPEPASRMSLGTASPRPEIHRAHASPRLEHPQGTRLSVPAFAVAVGPSSTETPRRSSQARLSPPPQFHQRPQLGVQKNSGLSSAGTPQRARTTT